MASKRSKFSQLFLTAVVAGASVLGISACSKKETDTQTQTPETVDRSTPSWFKDQYINISLEDQLGYSFYTFPADVREDMLNDFCNRDIFFLLQSFEDMRLDPSLQNASYMDIEARNQLLNKPPTIKNESDIAENNRAVYTSKKGDTRPSSFSCNIGIIWSVKLRNELLRYPDVSYSSLQEMLHSWLSCQVNHIAEYEFNVRTLHKIDPRFSPLEGAFRRGYERARSDTTLAADWSEDGKSIRALRCSYPKIR